MSEKIRVAIIGTGTMGVIHANAYMNNPQVQVIAACDVDETALKRFTLGPWNYPQWWPKVSGYPCLSRPKYEVKKMFTDYQEVAKDLEIDAVSICLSTAFHTSVSIAMLESGKHVLVEKPMAGTVNECQKMIKVAQQANRKLQVGHMWRFHPEVNLVKQVIEGGILGRIVKTKGYAIYVRSVPSGWFLKKELAVGGPLLDVGVHAIDTVRYLLGDPKPERVYAKVKTVYGNYDIDDMGIVIVEFSNGTVSIIETGQNHPYSDGVEASTQLFGTKGYARVFPTEVQFKIENHWGSFKPDIHEPHISPIMFQREVDHFIDCILNDKEPITSGEVAIEAVRIVEASYKSSKTGKVVYIPDFCQ